MTKKPILPTPQIPGNLKDLKNLKKPEKTKAKMG